jgi:ABC-type dipeptide/oligopeptide/nickel transport system permease component
MGNLFMGAVLVEIVFRWPGMGTLIFDSIISRDYAMVQIVFLILAIIVVLANLAADIAYAVVDPRIRYR